MYMRLLKPIIILILILQSGVASNLTQSFHFEEDFELSKRTSLVSGIKLADWKANTAVVTIGFSQLKEGYPEHAFFVIEKRQQNSNSEDTIVAEGIDLGGSDWVIKFLYGRDKTTTQTVINSYDHVDILKLFVRRVTKGADLLSHDDFILERPVYEKFRSFIISDIQVHLLKQRVLEDSQQIQFCGYGNIFSDNQHNCVSYAIRVMNFVGIHIQLPWYYLCTSPNLRQAIEDYEKAEVSRKVFKPKDYKRLLIEAGAQDQIPN